MMRLKHASPFFRIPEPIKNEIVAIILFFVFVFLVVSLLSYHPADPSFNNAKAVEEINNWFGLLGAEFSGLLIGFFGLGAFWIPMILLIVVFHLLSGHHPREIITTIAGGFILILTTGALLSVWKDYYQIYDLKLTSGGIAGISLRKLLVAYANTIGAVIILLIIWNIGFILTTGISSVTFVQECLERAKILQSRLKIQYVIWRERRERARRRPIIIDPSEESSVERENVVTEEPIETIVEEKISLIKSLIVRKPVLHKANIDEVNNRQEVLRTSLGGEFQMPPFDLLDAPEPRPASTDREYLENRSRVLERKLEDFGVRGDIVAVTPGPVITTFEYQPAPGIKINKVVSLTDDLALALKAISIRIVAPIPGKAVIGIEIPNDFREIVKFKDIVSSDVFAKSKSKLTLCLGKDIVGYPVVADLDKMPHLLIAGATGTGKSVGLNSMITSFLYKSTPEDIKLIMIDPKRIELSIYDGIPHLITPVVTDVKKATNALFWAVREMEQRYELLSQLRVRNIAQYNRKVRKEMEEKGRPGTLLPYIVVIIDELADLMIVAPREVEVALMRLAQMARAAGIHLILATQRPSVNVLTGIIKANFPTRLSYQVSSKIDSRTIIDGNGAESLLGNGDMLFQPPGTAKLQRIHGPFISEEEIIRVTDFIKQQEQPKYNQKVVNPLENETEISEDLYDERYDEAVDFVTKTGKASTSMIQRHLRIGYKRAARIIEIMEREGVVGPADGVKTRDVLVKNFNEI